MLLAYDASADELTWDDPIRPEEIENVRYFCAEAPDDEVCANIAGTSDEALLERLEALRASCLRWESLEPAIREADRRYPEMSLRVLPVILTFSCNVSVGTRAYSLLRVSDSPGLLDTRIKAAAERVVEIQRTEETRDELLERLGDAFLSLELQREQGSLRAKDYEKLRDNLLDCEELAEEGPHRVARGLSAEEWMEKARLCTDSSIEAVFERAREEDEGSGLAAWLFFFGGIVIAGGLALIIVSRRERHAGVLELETWRRRLDELESEIEREAADAEAQSDLSIYNSHMARIAALRRWIDHFGPDARAHHVETSLNSANISERNYTWFGYSDRSIPPISTVSGTPREFFERLYRVVGRSIDPDS